MRESFIGEKFRHEHREERSEEEHIGDEAGVAITVADPSSDERDGLPDDKEEAGEEQCPDKRVEDGIGRVVMPPILVAEEIVFDKGSRERFGKRRGDVSMIDFRRKNRNMSRAGREVFGVSDKKVIEHRESGDQGAE